MIDAAALNACFSDTMDSLAMRILFYLGLCNFFIIFLVFIINGTISLELIRKLRKFIFYSFAIFLVPFIVAFITYCRL